MQYLVTYEALRKIQKKHKACRIESLLVHAFAQYINGTFSVDYLADLLDMKPSDVRGILSSSAFFFSDGEHFRKRERLSSLYGGSLLGYEDGKITEVCFSDIEKQNIPIDEPVIDLCMKLIHQHGNCLSLLGMSILLAVHEGYKTKDELTKRLDTHLCLQGDLDHLVKTKVLSAKETDGEVHYLVGAVGGEIYKTLFKSRLSV